MLHKWVWTTTLLVLGAPAGAQSLAEAPDDAGDPPTHREGRQERREQRAPAPADAPEPPAQPLPWWRWENATGEWGRLRPSLVESGIELSSTLIYDIGAVFDGGLRESSAGRGLLDVSLFVDFEALAGLEGSSAYADFLNHWGGNGSDDAGDFQGLGNIDARSFSAIAELWWEQKLLDGALRIKAGKIEGNSEFAYADSSGDHLNSGFGLSPTLYFVFPTYPDPATGAVVFMYPDPALSIGFGVFDGAAHEGVRTGERGPQTLFGSPADLFLIGQVELRWNEGRLPGRASAGGWGHTGDFERFDGGLEDGTAGFYLTLDQSLWRAAPDDPEDERGVGVFALAGWADPDVSEAHYHLGAGLVWNGPIAGREDDATGVGATWVGFSSEDGAGFDDAGELAVELFYRLQITPSFSVKPDLQWIMNPSGDADVDDAFVATIRVEVRF